MEEDYTLEDLRTKLNDIFADETCSLNLYAIIKLDDNFSIRRVSFDGSLTETLQEHMENSVKASNLFDEDTSLKNLSECDDRRNVVCKLDMEVGGELDCFVELNNNHGDEYETLNLERNLKDIRALVVDIGNSAKQIQIYNHIYPTEILGKKRFIVSMVDNKLRKIDNPLLLINTSFQAIQVNGDIVVTNIKFIEQHAGYKKVIREKALSACTSLTTFGCIENVSYYENLIEGDDSLARKLSRISEHSPVIQKNIPHSTIIAFCKSYPALKNKIKFNSGETKIFLHTKVAMRLILKLFLDDHLTSELTTLHYESQAKDIVEPL